MEGGKVSMEGEERAGVCEEVCATSRQCASLLLVSLMKTVVSGGRRKTRGLGLGSRVTVKSSFSTPSMTSSSTNGISTHR